jgi:hypothetical protein
VHLQERAHRCDQCGKSYSSKARTPLPYAHTHIHTRARHSLGRGGPQAYLAVHLRMHAGERPFVCAVATCQKAFRQRQHLREHVKTHHTHAVVQVPRAPSLPRGLTVVRALYMCVCLHVWRWW